MSDELLKKTFAKCLILEKIGQGGMGIVYKAHSINLNKAVCVKILPKELEADPRNIDFFLREAEISKQLDHPNTVHVYDYGKEKDKYYIVMSYVEGKSLEEIIKEKKTLAIAEASDIIMGVLKGLEHAHSKNIIHRDIKPSNIIINNEGIPRIIDFGLARRVVEEKQLTITGEMIGTAYFMSPEQGLGKKVDHRADLYALGATYFYMLTGKYPYEGKSAIEVINKHINDPVPNLYMLRPDLPIWVVKIIEKLMRKNPEERFSSATDVINELKKYKEKNYENVILSEESEYNLEDIKDKHQNINTNDISKSIRREEIKDIGIESDKIKKEETKRDHNKKEETNQINVKQAKKIVLQSSIIFNITRIIKHLSYTLLTIVFLTLFTTSNSTYSYPLFIKSVLSKPFFLVFLIGGFFMIYFTIRTLPINFPFTYISTFLIMLITTVFTIKYNTQDIQNLIDKIIYIVNSIKIKNENLFIISFIMAIISHNLSDGDSSKTKRIISSILLISSIFILWISLQTILNIQGHTTPLYIIIVSLLVYCFVHTLYLRKNFILLLYLISTIFLTSQMKSKYIGNTVELMYKQEIEKYKQKKNEIIMRVQDRFYSNLSSTNNSFVSENIEEKLKQEIKQELINLKEPDKNDIQNQVSTEYYKYVITSFHNLYRKHLFIALIFLWISLNIIFINGLFKKDYEN